MKDAVKCKVMVTELSIGGKYPGFEASKEKEFGDLIVKEAKIYSKGDIVVFPKKFAKSLGPDVKILGPAKTSKEEIEIPPEGEEEIVPETKKSEEEKSLKENSSSSENFSYPMSLQEKIRRFFLDAFR